MRRKSGYQLDMEESEAMGLEKGLFNWSTIQTITQLNQSDYQALLIKYQLQ